MPRYLIEREMPGAGRLSQKDLIAVSQKSLNASHKLGTQVQWMESFITDNRMYCFYVAPDKSLMMEHAHIAGFPANRIEEVRHVINPVTAET